MRHWKCLIATVCLVAILTTGCSQPIQVDEVKPSLPGPEPTTAEEYCQRGNSLYNDERYEEASEDFTRALELDPVNIEAFIGRSKTYPHLDEWDKAMADCTKAIEMNTTSPIPYYIRALIHTHGEGYNSASINFNKAICLENTETNFDEMSALINLVVPRDELVLLDACCSSSRTSNCGKGTCSEYGWRICVKVHLFVNPLDSITATGIYLVPSVGDELRVELSRTFNDTSIQKIVTMIGGETPGPSRDAHGYVSYKSYGHPQLKESNADWNLINAWK